MNACGRAAHIGVGLLLALWGHAHWPLVLGGLLPLAAWLAAVGWLRGQSPQPETAGLARRAAQLGMLPMMAGLPTMLDLCSGAAGGIAAVAAGHAAAMLLPPALLWLLPARLRPHRSVLCAALLLAGGLLLAAPGVQGLMLATLAHAAAWSVAVCRAQPMQPVQRPRFRGFDALPVFSVLAMGAALDAVGPQALFFVHGALALFGLVSGLVLVAARLLQPGPASARF